MGQILHGCATTTEAVRRAIHAPMSQLRHEPQYSRPANHVVGARVQASTRSLSRLPLGILSGRNNAPKIKRDRKACERNADCSANDLAHSIYHASVAIRREQLQ